MINESRKPDHFSVNFTQMKLADGSNPLSPAAVDLYDGQGMSTQDRLFFCLHQNTALGNGEFNPGDRVAVCDGCIGRAYFPTVSSLLSLIRHFSLNFWEIK